MANLLLRLALAWSILFQAALAAALPLPVGGGAPVFLCGTGAGLQPSPDGPAAKHDAACALACLLTVLGPPPGQMFVARQPVAMAVQEPAASPTLPGRRIWPFEPRGPPAGLA